MPVYSLYLIRNRVREPPEIINCETDMEALEKAQAAADCDFELWEGPRMLVAVERPQKEA
jgi:hypothetical protein